MKSSKKDILDNIKLYEDFYSTFYNLNFPIYTMNKTRRNRVYSSFVTGFSWIKSRVLFRKDTYISISNKFIDYRKDKMAKNTITNTRSNKYFVVDIDSDYRIKPGSANNILFALEQLGMFESCPRPTAVVASGCGFHFYYLIDEIYLPKTSMFSSDKDYKQWRDEKISLYSDGAEVVRRAVKKALDDTTPYIKNLDRMDKLIVDSLKVDSSVLGNTQQLIRAPGTYNSRADQYATIISLNKFTTYTLTQLLEDYKPKSKKIEGTNIVHFRRNGVYEKADVVALNIKRLEDMKTLVNLRKDSGNLKGSRQNIMSNFCWLLINTNHNIENSADKLDVKKELLELGKMIGDEFASENFVESKIRHIKRYHERYSAIGNVAMINFLMISLEELSHLSGITLGRETLRENRKKEKKRLKERLLELIDKGVAKAKIARILDISRQTVYNWLKELIEMEEKVADSIKSIVYLDENNDPVVDVNEAFDLLATADPP